MSKSASRARLAEIIRKRSFGRGEITLASGRKSDFYFNLKPTMLDPEGAALLAELTFDALKDDSLDYVGGLEMGAVPLAGAIAQLSWIKGHPIAAFFVRKKPKEHGARLSIEGLAKGESLQGKRVVIVEDVTTTGGSALKDDNLDYVGGLEMGAVPLAGAIAQLSWLKGHPIAAFFVRKKPKEHGARLAVEGLAKGESLQGKRVVIVEDVTTTGGSALKAVEAVREAGAEVALVLTMVDRDEGASETFAQAGLAFRSLYKAGEFLKD